MLHWQFITSRLSRSISFFATNTSQFFDFSDSGITRNQKRIVEHVDWVISLPKYQWNVESYWWKFSRWYEGWPIELLENFLTWWNFKVGQTTSVLRFAYDQAILTMLWNKEVEIAKSNAHFVTSRSIAVRDDFLDFDMLDAMIASALKKLLNTLSNSRNSKCRRAGSSERRPFLRWRQIAFMIYESFRATVVYDAAEGHSTLCAMSLQIDYVQDVYESTPMPCCQSAHLLEVLEGSMQRRFGVQAQTQLYWLDHRRKAVRFLSSFAVENQLMH